MLRERERKSERERERERERIEGEGGKDGVYKREKVYQYIKV